MSEWRVPKQTTYTAHGHSMNKQTRYMEYRTNVLSTTLAVNSTLQGSYYPQQTVRKCAGISARTDNQACNTIIVSTLRGLVNNYRWWGQVEIGRVINVRLNG